MQRSGANVQKKPMKTEVVEEIVVKTDIRQRGSIVRQKINGSVNSIKNVIHAEGTLKNGLKKLWRQSSQNDRHVEEHEIDAMFPSGFQPTLPSDTNITTQQQMRDSEGAQKKPTVDETDAALIREFQATKMHISMSNAKKSSRRNNWKTKSELKHKVVHDKTVGSMTGGGGHSKRCN